jgi:hypothetical protein
MTDIKVTYSSIDGVRKSRRFKTLAGASAFAKHWIGDSPDISGFSSYAVSDDGVGKITCTGCTLTALFYGEPAKGAGDYSIVADPDDDLYRVFFAGRLLGVYETYPEAAEHIGMCRQNDMDEELPDSSPWL